MIVWLLTFGFALACWAFAVFRIHSNFFNLITYFKGDGHIDKYGELTGQSVAIIIITCATFFCLFFPVLNLIVGSLLVGASYAYPLLISFWEYLNKVGK